LSARIAVRPQPFTFSKYCNEVRPPTASLYLQVSVRSAALVAGWLPLFGNMLNIRCMFIYYSSAFSFFSQVNILFFAQI
jgi:hypothetical protein